MSWALMALAGSAAQAAEPGMNLAAGADVAPAAVLALNIAPQIAGQVAHRNAPYIAAQPVIHHAPAGPLPDGTPLAALVSEGTAPPDLAPFAAPAPETAPESASPPAAAAVPDAAPEGAVENLRAAIVAALKGNPEIQIALAQQDDARWAVSEARAAYLPHLDVTGGYGLEMNKAGHSPATHLPRLEATATLGQNLWDFGITINDIKRARAAYRSAQWATREKIEAIAYDITNAYLGVLQSQKLVGLASDELAATQKILRVVTVQKDLGLTTPADVSRAQTRLDNVKSQLLDRQSQLAQAQSTYRRLTDHVPGLAVDLPEAQPVLPASAEAAVALIDDHAPRMAQAVEDRRSLAKQYASELGTFMPRIGLMAQANHKFDVAGATGLANDARAMVTVTYNIFNGGADRALLHRISARVREADFEVERRRREVAQDIRIDFEALQAARGKIATIEAEIDSAQKVVELYRQQFREGHRTVFDLLESEQTLSAARASQITNRIAMHAAEYRVLQKLGGLFELVSEGEPLPQIRESAASVLSAADARAAARAAEQARTRSAASSTGAIGSKAVATRANP
jgi:TolC family type I secretion outer membrane protein